MIEVGYKTDKGKRRSHNEDSCLVMENEQIYIVADGVGGNKAGELASKTAVNEVADFVRKESLAEISDPTELGTQLNKCVRQVNDSILKLGLTYPEYKGMASTLVICYIRENHAYFVNVGDSRAYIRRGNEMFQVTEDHSYVNTLVKLGVITRDEAVDHQKGHVITKAMGAEEKIEADFYQTDVEDGDILLLCSDGLYGELKEVEINQCITKYGDMNELAKELVDRANAAGGRDNISVVCMKVVLKGGKNE